MHIRKVLKTSWFSRKTSLATFKRWFQVTITVPHCPTVLNYVESWASNLFGDSRTANRIFTESNYFEFDAVNVNNNCHNTNSDIAKGPIFVYVISKTRFWSLRLLQALFLDTQISNCIIFASNKIYPILDNTITQSKTFEYRNRFF